MSDVVYEAANSEDNCYHSDLGEIVGHKVDEIYTCIDCLEELIREQERKRIVQILNSVIPDPHGEHEECDDCWFIRHALELIENDK